MAHRTATSENFTEWALRPFSGPPVVGKPQAFAIVALLMVAIGISDAAISIYVSLMFFYFVPMVLAMVWLGWRAAVAVACVGVVFRLLGDFRATDWQPLPFWSWWNSLFVLLVFLFAIWLLNAYFELRRRLEQRVAERTAELVEAAETRRVLEKELLAVNSRERQTLGQELHDEICQQLVGTAMAAQVLAHRLLEEKSGRREDASRIVALIEEAADKARKLAHGLLLSEIAPADLPEKLGEIADRASGDGVTCRFRHLGSARAPDADAAAQLFRIAQEATRNALRHANPRHIEITLSTDEDGIALAISDDGIGLGEPESGGGMGLKVMSNRARFIGATLSFEPQDHGTRVVCRLPFKPY